MLSRYTQKKLTWIDLESPTREETALLAEEYDLHPVVVNELLSPSERAKVDVYDNAIYLILHFPLRHGKTGHIEEVEVDFVLMRETIITTHYELVDPLHDFAHLFETGGHMTSVKHVEHAGYLFFVQVRDIYKHALFLLETIGHDIRDIEKHIFSGEEEGMVERISRTNRSLIDIRQAIRYHGETLRSLEHACTNLYGSDFAYYVSAITGEYERIVQAADEHRRTLRDLRETNDSLLSMKATQTIRKLTALNVIMLPLAFITWIFAMHSQYLSLDDPFKLKIVFLGMLLIGLVSTIYFRTKKWL